MPKYNLIYRLGFRIWYGCTDDATASSSGEPQMCLAPALLAEASWEGIRGCHVSLTRMWTFLRLLR